MQENGLHKKAPSVGALEASDVKTYEGVHGMNSNANAADINVQGKTAQVFRFKQQQEVRAVLIDGEPWFVAADVCESLEFKGRSRDYIRMLDEDEKGAHILRTLGGDQQVQIVNESGLYSLIFKSRKPEAKAFKKWVTAEVLPAIRKHGRYEDSSNKMTTLVNDVIGVSGTNLINGVIGQKIAILPVGVQRQAKHKLHSILHTRFNVPRTELIPAEKLDVACEYLAAYALEGEWLSKESKHQPNLSYPIETLVARRAGMLTIRNDKQAWLDVTLHDLRDIRGDATPCEKLLGELDKAGYDIEGCWWELRTYRNKVYELASYAERITMTVQEPHRYAVSPRAVA
jgi:prophage antirepressor-like protein